MLFGLGDDKVELDLLSEQQVREREGVQRRLAHLRQRLDMTGMWFLLEIFTFSNGQRARTPPVRPPIVFFNSPGIWG